MSLEWRNHFIYIIHYYKSWSNWYIWQFTDPTWLSPLQMVNECQLDPLARWFSVYSVWNYMLPSLLFSCFAGMVHGLFLAIKQDKVISNHPEARGLWSRFKNLINRGKMLLKADWDQISSQREAQGASNLSSTGNTRSVIWFRVEEGRWQRGREGMAKTTNIGKICTNLHKPRFVVMEFP